MNASILLVSAVLVSLGVGVMLAQGLCVLMFRLFSIHVQQVQQKRFAPGAVPARVSGN